MGTLHIAFDDTDSRLGRCTTHLAFKLTQKLLRFNAKFVDYPNLIRLNPNIPWKTRGNGAVCLRVEVNDVRGVVDLVLDTVEQSSAIGTGANPGVVFYEGETIPDEVKSFSSQAMHAVMSKQMAEKIAIKSGVKYSTFGNGQGIVGSLAALGCSLIYDDHTFELIGYRQPENCGSPRIVDKQKVIEFSKKSYPETFNNYDPINDRILVAPHGPDPVFVGIRGESPDAVSAARFALGPTEKLEGWTVFRTNQGTNMHLRNELVIADIKAYVAGIVHCTVHSKPEVGAGGHVYFMVEQAGLTMPAAVYEPTGLYEIACKLLPGDLVEIGCGVRKGTSKHPKILNVEYLRILQVTRVFEYSNPQCLSCGKRMKSEGRGKGFQCSKCKYRDPKATKVETLLHRDLKAGLYVPVATAHRHLTKPLHRYGKEKKSIGKSSPISEFLFMA